MSPLFDTGAVSLSAEQTQQNLRAWRNKNQGGNMFSWIKSLVVKEPKQDEKGFKVYGKTVTLTEEEVIAAQPQQTVVSERIGKLNCGRCGRFVSRSNDHTCPTSGQRRRTQATA